MWRGSDPRHWQMNGPIGMSGGGAHRVDPAPPSQPLSPPSAPNGGRHASHRLVFGPANGVVRQNGASPEQSVSAMHATHAFLAVSQMGSPASNGHCVLVVHPGLHAPPRHTGPAAEDAQSLSAMHSTQRFAAVSQRRCAPPSPALQSLVAVHWTHWLVVMSHTGRRSGPPASGEQSELPVQPTHAPVAGSQRSSGATQAMPVPPSTAHAAWHV
jgi:hypothetical protein